MLSNKEKFLLERFCCDLKEDCHPAEAGIQFLISVKYLKSWGPNLVGMTIYDKVSDGRGQGGLNGILSYLQGLEDNS